MQMTLKRSFRLEGVGLHSGRCATLVVRPAQAGAGIVFRRTDIGGAAGTFRGIYDQVRPSPLCTLLVNATGNTLSTIEHLMAALAGAQCDNAVVEIDGPEIPILDGSSLPFQRAISQAGLIGQSRPRLLARVRRKVEVREGAAWARLVPGEGFRLDAEIDFPDAAIGRQGLSVRLEDFARELSACRTFCRASDVAAMRAAGLALGGSYENAVVVDGEKILSPGGLRREREFVRHKLLDAVGDLALLGARIEGTFQASRPGHALTNKLLRAAVASPGALVFEEERVLEEVAA